TAALSEHHGWSSIEAQQRLNALIDHGFAGLIALYSSIAPKEARRAYERSSVEHTFEFLVKRLSHSMQMRFRERLAHLEAALAETEAPLNLARLLNEVPLCDYRRRIKRQKLPEALIESFARHAGFAKKSEAYTCLEHLLTYGLIGLLLIREWKDLFDPRIQS